MQCLLHHRAFLGRYTRLPQMWRGCAARLDSSHDGTWPGGHERSGAVCMQGTGLMHVLMMAGIRAGGAWRSRGREARAVDSHAPCRHWPIMTTVRASAKACKGPQGWLNAPQPSGHAHTERQAWVTCLLTWQAKSGLSMPTRAPGVSTGMQTMVGGVWGLGWGFWEGRGGDPWGGGVSAHL